MGDQCVLRELLLYLPKYYLTLTTVLEQEKYPVTPEFVLEQGKQDSGTPGLLPEICGVLVRRRGKEGSVLQ